MGKIVKASTEHECDRCFGVIKEGETYEYTLVKNPIDFKHFGGTTHTICHFHNYDCLNQLPDIYHVQEIDLNNISRHGTSNNQ